ncbi:MAG: type II secretion system F family protein, partial [Candidatus Pacebacteria bacterium]|nr:type II secretion system F family protein [Candidatus Paceibacterota bacterium]
MKFKYKIKNKNNEMIEGIAESPDKFILAREFREKGDTPISIQELKDKSGDFSFSKNLLNRVSLSEKVMFTNNLSGMLSAGLSVNRALAILEKQSTNSAFINVMHDLGEEINKGNTLSDGMKKYPKVFSGIFIPMIHAGEESGSLPKTLKEVGISLKKAYDLNKKIKGAMTYPTIIIFAMAVIGVFMMIYVVPTLTKTFKDLGTELPGSTKAIIWISDSLSQHLLLFVSTIIGIVILTIFLSKLKSVQRIFDKFILYLPVIGKIVKEVNTARTARTLSSLLLSGVNISNALSITEEVVQNVHYKELIHTSISNIEKGMVLSASFKENTFLYPVMMGEMIEVGEETGNSVSYTHLRAHE